MTLGVLALISLGLPCGIFLSSENRATVNAIVIAAVIGLYAAEIFISQRDMAAARELIDQQVAAKERIFSQAAREGREVDQRSRQEFLLDYQGRGLPASPAVYPLLLLSEEPGQERTFRIQGRDVLPLSGQSDRTLVYCNEAGTYRVARSDRFGFSNEPSVWASPADIAVLGDSFVEGACVAPGKDLVGQIRNFFPASINLGASGNGPLLELASIQEYLSLVRPRIVLWVYYEGNDLERESIVKEQNAGLLKSYLKPGFHQNLVEIQQEIDLAWQEFIDDSVRSATRLSDGGLRQLLREIDTAGERAAPPAFQSVIRLRNLRHRLRVWAAAPAAQASYTYRIGLNVLRQCLVVARDLVRGWGGELVFVYLPSWARYGYRIDPPRFLETRADVIQIVDELRVPLIDLHPPMTGVPDAKDRLWVFPNSHLSEDGYRFVAETIVSGLASRSLLSVSAK